MASAAPAFARHHGGSASAGGCVSKPVSAIDQYCELLPSATGGSAPPPGSPAAALPASAVSAIAHTGARDKRRRLLTIPAASGRVAISGPASTGTPWLLLLLILLAILLILGGIAAARRRRRPHPRGGPHPA